MNDVVPTEANWISTASTTVSATTVALTLGGTIVAPVIAVAVATILTGVYVPAYNVGRSTSFTGMTIVQQSTEKSAMQSPSSATSAPHSEKFVQWEAYLTSLDADNCEVAPPQLRCMREVWSQITNTFGTLISPPAAGLLDNGVFFMSWSRGPHYCEIELTADGGIEWFYKNRETRELDGTDDEADASLSSLFMSRLSLLKELS